MIRARTAEKTNQLFLFKDGKVMAILRPENAALKMAQFAQIKDGITPAEFDAELWGEDEVVVMPTPDLKGDSNTAVVVKSPKEENRGAVVLRGGVTEVDCHLPTLNKIITGDPERHYTRPQCGLDSGRVDHGFRTTH